MKDLPPLLSGATATDLQDVIVIFTTAIFQRKNNDHVTLLWLYMDQETLAALYAPGERGQVLQSSISDQTSGPNLSHVSAEISDAAEIFSRC
jgi:hypothetical protein